MCGIVGYVGARDATPIIYEGLKRLEYRGYDSAGLAVIQNGGIETPLLILVFMLRKKLPSGLRTR